MPLEVEQKYRVASLKPTIAAIGAWDLAIHEPVMQIDCYYRHPQRDFAETDEALRLRSVGGQNFLTYKGPKLDQSTKTRVEEEIRLADGETARQTCDKMLQHLGFTPVATVTKHRSLCHLQREGFSIEIALDDVDGLGTFAELEVKGIQEPSDLELAKQRLEELAHELSLSEVERRSYLELLLEQR